MKQVNAGGFSITLLQSQKGTVYEPRSGTFSGKQKEYGPQSRAMYAIGRGHMKHYNNNGTGRDAYIYENHGGFTKMYQPISWPQVGTFQSAKFHVRPPPAPVIHAKPVYYRANGGGRDTYIETTSGGQFNSTNSNFEYRDNFKKSLRQYQVSSVGKSQRPLYSAYVNHRIAPKGRENQIIFGDHAYKDQQNRTEQAVRASLNKDQLKSLLADHSNALSNSNSQQNLQKDDILDINQFQKMLMNKSQSILKTSQSNQKKDILVESQQTFPQSFVETQSKLSQYQKHLDLRLAEPKYQRKRIIGSSLHDKEQQLRGIYGNIGSFNNQNSWKGKLITRNQNASTLKITQNDNPEKSNIEDGKSGFEVQKVVNGRNRIFRTIDKS